MIVSELDNHLVYELVKDAVFSRDCECVPKELEVICNKNTMKVLVKWDKGTHIVEDKLVYFAVKALWLEEELDLVRIECDEQAERADEAESQLKFDKVECCYKVCRGLVDIVNYAWNSEDKEFPVVSAGVSMAAVIDLIQGRSQ